MPGRRRGGERFFASQRPALATQKGPGAFWVARPSLGRPAICASFVFERGRAGAQLLRVDCKTGNRTRNTIWVWALVVLRIGCPDGVARNAVELHKSVSNVWPQISPRNAPQKRRSDACERWPGSGFPSSAQARLGNSGERMVEISAPWRQSHGPRKGLGAASSAPSGGRCIGSGAPVACTALVLLWESWRRKHTKRSLPMEGVWGPGIDLPSREDRTRGLGLFLHGGNGDADARGSITSSPWEQHAHAFWPRRQGTALRCDPPKRSWVA